VEDLPGAAAAALSSYAVGSARAVLAAVREPQRSNAEEAVKSLRQDQAAVFTQLDCDKLVVVTLLTIPC
jgi:hypothetical protein